MTAAAPERILTVDQIAERTERLATAWLAGRDVKPDELLERSIREHGLSIAEIVARCAELEQRGRR
jgi:hypothetical protein